MIFDKLQQIYNTLMLVETRGENSYIMVDCLRAFNSVLQEMKEEAKNEYIVEK